MESLSSCFCTGNEIPVATANTHSSTTVPKEPSGTVKPRHNAIVMVSPNTAPTGPNARRTRCGRAAPRASKIVIAASTAPNQFTERDFDSRIGWNRLTWQIRTSVNIATPCTISNASQRDVRSVDSAPPTPAISDAVFPAPRPPGIAGSFTAKTRATPALIAVSQYGEGRFHDISSPITGQYTILPTRLYARPTPSARRYCSPAPWACRYSYRYALCAPETSERASAIRTKWTRKPV